MKKLKVGDRVVFKDKVFKGVYVPHYDEYKGHVFEIVNIWNQQVIMWDEENFDENFGHVKLKCVSGKVKLKGHVHEDEIKKYNK